MIKHILSVAILLAVYTSAISQHLETIQVVNSKDNINKVACADQFAGNVSLGEVVAQSNATSLPGPIFLCYQDRFTVLNSNADLTGDPIASTQPGIGYAFFDCPPIATGPNISDIEADPCVLNTPPPTGGSYDLWVYTDQPDGTALFQNSNQLGGMTIPQFFNNGNPIQIYFAPITFDDFGNNLDEDGGDCFSMTADEAFPVVYLNEIVPVNCQVSLVNNEYVGSFTIEGGYPEYNGSTYKSVAVVKNSNFNNQATIIGGPFMHGDLVEFIADEPGNYTILIEDDVSCGISKDLVIQEEEKEMTINVTIPNMPYQQGDIVCASFCVADFDSITSMEFTINFDPTVLAWDSTLPGPLDDLTTFNFPTFGVDNGFIPFAWFESAATGVNLADGTCIFDVCFEVVGNPGDCSDIFIDGSPTAINVSCCENDLAVELNYNNTELCIEEPNDVQIFAGACGANNSDTGSITFYCVGGTPPYQYASNCFNNGTISSSGTEETIYGISAGICTIDVLDAAGNTAQIMVTVGDESPIDYDVFVSDPTCYGVPNGRIAIRNINGGNPDYFLSWSNNIYDTDSIQSLIGGIYFVTIEDETGCKVEQAVEVGTEPIYVDIDLLDTTSCVTSEDGTVFADASGGTPFSGNRYDYQWNNPTLFESNVINSTNVNVPSGLGSVRVTDDNGCSVTIEYDMPFLKEVTADIQLTEPICSDSLGTIVVTGGTSNNSCSQFSFNWSGGLITFNDQTTSTAENLDDGDYFVTITDCDGCELDTMITVDSPSPISLPVIPEFDCSMPTGCITVFPGGGTGQVTLSWSDDPLEDSSIRCGLAPGSYTISAVDENGCTAEVTVDLSPGTQIIPDSIYVTPISCAGDEDGVIFVDLPGNPTVTFEWEGPQGGGFPNAETITGLGAGNYFVTITDGMGCTIVDSAEIIAPDTIFTNPTLTLPNCNGESNGTIALAVTGGDDTNGYVFSWSGFPGVVGPILSNIGPASYDVTIFDSNGCSKDTTIVLPDQEIIDISVNIIQDIPCNGDSTGIVEVEFTGGKVDNGNYGVIWNSGENEPLGAISTDTAFSLYSGMNEVIVFDEQCADTLTFDLIEPSAILLDVVNTTVEDASCFGICDGTALATAQGGVGNYDYTWVDQSVNSALITGLCAGFQVVEITDGNDCIVLDSVFVNQPDSLVLEVDLDNTFNPACSNDGDGLITVDYTGGNIGPVTYDWTDNVSDDASASGLNNGLYTITVTDQIGCSDTTSYRLSSLPPVSADVPTPLEPICFGDKTCIQVENPSGGTGTNYRFSINSSNLFPIDSCVEVFAGEYLITIFDSEGCSYDTTILINQPSELLASLGNDLVVGLGDSTSTVEVQLNQSFVLDSLVWTGNVPYECFNNDCTKIFVYPATDGVIEVLAIDENGCVASDEVIIRIDDERKVYFPNIFTPNGDGINDNFQLFTGRGVEEIVLFQVFDRWGNKMYEESGISPNPGGTVGWDGTFNGQLLDPGVYSYRADILFVDEKIVPYSGSITLVR